MQGDSLGKRPGTCSAEKPVSSYLVRSTMDRVAGSSPDARYPSCKPTVALGGWWSCRPPFQRGVFSARSFPQRPDVVDLGTEHWRFQTANSTDSFFGTAAFFSLT